ncbi:MAG TPA: acetylxylan esterase [Clostridia bacterium]|jgi:hypothetical protein|nr:MAG: Acetyl xylan esterase (AXE1) [Firmicutes bacterium ADurb.Bin146]HOD93782.1 acetylxylan esterase [Clostridia bacterium]
MAQYRILKDSIKAAKQLENEIVSYSLQLFNQKQTDFYLIKTKQDWENEKKRIKEIVKNAFPKILFEKRKLNVTLVSSFEFDNFRIENVLFNSIMGWQVNASVYIPKGIGPFPAVICPTGHSSKFTENYYIPAQMFASNGYIAVSFCPPGCSGELAYRNDHFVNGYSGWIVGMWSQTYFIADAMACVDYVYSLDYCDTSKKVSISGVSGGGTTSMYTAILDDRISFLAPVCCINNNQDDRFNDLYTACPETFGKGFAFNGIDTTSILACFAPDKLFIVGGEKDEVFDYRVTQKIYERVKHIYSLYGKEDNIEIYIEKNTGHKYSPTMALEAIKRMNKIQYTETKALVYCKDKIIDLKREQLSCYPSQKVNMHTINKEIACNLKNSRKILPYELLKLKLLDILDIGRMATQPENIYEQPISEIPSRWCHKFRNIVINHSSGCEIPLIHAFREDMIGRPLLLWFGEQGAWEQFNKKGPLSKITGFLERVPLANEHSIMSFDISGLGELEMQHSTYDAASWNRIERILTYISVYNNRPVMSYRVRDILIALNYAKQYSSDITIAGYGIGAISALFAAFIAKDDIKKVIAVKPLCSYESIATEPSFEWPESILVPNILTFTDIPELLVYLGKKAICINPIDSYMKTINKDIHNDIYKESIEKGAKIIYDEDWENAFVKAAISKD